MEQLFVKEQWRYNIFRPASPAEVWAAAATLDGAREVYTDWATGHYLPINSADVLKPGRYLVIPLPDKETT